MVGGKIWGMDENLNLKIGENIEGTKMKFLRFIVIVWVDVGHNVGPNIMFGHNVVWISTKRNQKWGTEKGHPLKTFILKRKNVLEV